MAYDSLLDIKTLETSLSKGDCLSEDGQHHLLGSSHLSETFHPQTLQPIFDVSW